MKKNTPARQNHITGIILASQWDESGNAIGLSVYSDQEDIYIIAPDKRIEKLKGLIQTRVRMWGKFKEDADGNKVVYVETVHSLGKDNER